MEPEKKRAGTGGDPYRHRKTEDTDQPIPELAALRKHRLVQVRRAVPRETLQWLGWLAAEGASYD